MRLAQRLQRAKSKKEFTAAQEEQLSSTLRDPTMQSLYAALERCLCSEVSLLASDQALFRNMSDMRYDVTKENLHRIARDLGRRWRWKHNKLDKSIGALDLLYLCRCDAHRQALAMMKRLEGEAQEVARVGDADA